MARVIVLGECMVELSPQGSDGEGLYRMGFAGDTFNTAIYMARLDETVSYCTAVGRGDPFSEGVLAALRREGLDDSLIRQAEDRLPGLYSIVLDDAGERRFYYWREHAPVRDMFSPQTAEILAKAAAGSDLIYLSGVTLAVIGELGRARLRDVLLAAADAGVAVALDVNYRPSLWSDPAVARLAVDAVRPVCAYISVSEEDAQPMYRRPVQDLAAEWASAGAEVVARDGGHAVIVHTPDGPVRTLAPERVKAVDTTGAGDSFNAAYLSARLARRPIAEAVGRGHALAAAVVSNYGAIIPREAMPSA